MGETLRIGWTYHELEVAVDAYLLMMAFQKSKQTYSKAEIRRKTLEGGLKNRSSASFEYRMQNISAVIADFGLLPVTGYLPASNIGRNAEIIKSILSTRLGLDSTIVAPTSNEAELENNVGILLQSGVIKKPIGVLKPARCEMTGQSSFYRSVLVKAWILQAASGICEGCDTPAPFNLTNGQPYLEVHHVKPLAEGGPDVVENVVALCPNCHRRCHLSVDRDAFTANLYLRVYRLVPA